MAEFSGVSPLTTVGITPTFQEASAFPETISAPDTVSTTIVIMKSSGAHLRQLISWSGRIVTSAAVGNRNVRLRILDGDGGAIYTEQQSVSIPASTTQFVSVISNKNVITTLNTLFSIFSIPALFWPQGYQIELSIIAPLAGDQWTQQRGLDFALPNGQGGYNLGRQP